MLKVVTIGGGNGQAIALRALKRLRPQVEIVGITTVADTGGSSGRLRKEHNVLPPGDIMRDVLALSSYSFAEVREIFYQNRLSEEKLKGHNIGNLLLVHLYKLTGDWVQAIKAFSEALKCQGTILPVSLDLVNLCMELENGQIIKGETVIDVADTYDCHLGKKKIWLEPEGAILGEAREAIISADYIILGPGDLYTSILPNLLVGGMADALCASKAKIVFVLPLFNRAAGETCGYKISDWLSELKKYLMCKVDHLITQDPDLAPPNEKYKEKNWEPIVADDGAWQREYAVIFADLHNEKGAGMDAEKLVKPLSEVLSIKY